MDWPLGLVLLTGIRNPASFPMTGCLPEPCWTGTNLVCKTTLQGSHNRSNSFRLRRWTVSLCFVLYPESFFSLKLLSVLLLLSTSRLCSSLGCLKYCWVAQGVEQRESSLHVYRQIAQHLASCSALSGLTIRLAAFTVLSTADFLLALVVLSSYI